LEVRPTYLVGKPIRHADVHSAAGSKRETGIVGEPAMPVLRFNAHQSLNERRHAAAGAFAEAHATTNTAQRIYLLAKARL
jgi:hypothetical protein